MDLQGARGGTGGHAIRAQQHEKRGEGHTLARNQPRQQIHGRELGTAELRSCGNSTEPQGAHPRKFKTGVGECRTEIRDRGRDGENASRNASNEGGNGQGGAIGPGTEAHMTGPGEGAHHTW